MTKYNLYEKLKNDLLKSVNPPFEVGDYEEINYGLQFVATCEDKSCKIRIYESKKKGVSLDLSLVKDEVLKEQILNIYSNGTIPMGEGKMQKSRTSRYKSDEWETPLIGVDESGKGDYFGPLVIAGVYADQSQKEKLLRIGVADSKTLTDEKIHQMALRIKEVCPYYIIPIGNKTYNELYEKIGNLNHLLAWGHAKVIDTLALKTSAPVALSDQFGNESLIKSKLMKNSQDILLEQRPRAEQNVVVAAASILARDAFVVHMKEMEKAFNQTFPKGAGSPILVAGKQFVGSYGKSRLNEVAKLHFKTTEHFR